jgi:hypothetical protein
MYYNKLIKKNSVFLWWQQLLNTTRRKKTFWIYQFNTIDKRL